MSKKSAIRSECAIFVEKSRCENEFVAGNVL